MTKTKYSTYRVNIPLGADDKLKATIIDINRIFALIEDRLDVLESRRGPEMATTHPWEKEIARERRR